MVFKTEYWAYIPSKYSAGFNKLNLREVSVEGRPLSIAVNPAFTFLLLIYFLCQKILSTCCMYRLPG